MKKSEENPRYSFQTLFFFLILNLLISAFLYKHPFIIYLSNALFTVLILSAAYVVSEKRTLFLITLGLAILTIFTTWYDLNNPNIIPRLIDTGLNVVYFGYLVSLFAIKVFKRDEINTDTIFATLCIYFLLAFFWGFAFQFLDILSPGSFDLGIHSHDNYSYIYYSFITLSTLGYGDIVPRTPPSQMLAAFETVMGQFFLAVVVARYVGILVARRQRGS